MISTFPLYLRLFYLSESSTRQPCSQGPPPKRATHRASRSDSNKARMSLTLTGPLTFRMIDREVSSMNSTRTWVTPPREPVRPRTYRLVLAVYEDQMERVRGADGCPRGTRGGVSLVCLCLSLLCNCLFNPQLSQPLLSLHALCQNCNLKMRSMTTRPGDSMMLADG